MQIVPRIQMEWTGNVWRSCVGFRTKYGDKIQTALLDEPYGIFSIFKTELEIDKEFTDWSTSYEEFSRNKHKLLGRSES
ncbi:hypothetical protein [Pleomorphovibrio marinus]|uniref:hypothetical protein n=1 Tax=Pleomorphovibrio marinus TaxID=2164132 RepID=UPI001300AB91|nr:hypothetical protein [Pleomorphovibrio marinus]